MSDTIEKIIEEFKRLVEADRKHGERSRKVGDYGPEPQRKGTDSAGQR